MRQFLSIVFCVSVMAPALAHGTSYYVATTGSDANPGTQSQPFNTIQKAANTVRAGDTVYVLPGTYSIAAPGNWPGQPNAASIYTSTSGTATAPIKYISTVKWGAKIVSSGDRTIWYSVANYITIQNFDITGRSGTGIGIVSSGDNNTIIGNHVHDWTSQYCDGSGSGMGIDIVAPTGIGNNTITNNVVERLHVDTVVCPAGQIHGIYLGYGSGVALH